MQILITGSSGLVGKKLTALLTQYGHHIIHLSTSKSGKDVFKWNPLKNELDDACLDGTEVVIHLAGANIFTQSWTEKRKSEIIDSRVNGIELILDACKRKGIKLKHFLSASGVGYYGNRYNEIVTENDAPGSGFASEVCREWESAASKMHSVSDQVSILRIGIVLARGEGFLHEMKRLSGLNLLAPLGTGKQKISWIHVDDLCQIFMQIIHNKLPAGIYNAASPNALSNSEITRMMNHVWKSINWPLNVPELILKLILGERAQELLGGQQVSVQKLLDSGFQFQFSRAEEAIKNLS